MKIIIGIDPGLSGAIVSLDQHGDIRAWADCPTVKAKKGKRFRSAEMARILCEMAHIKQSTACYIEQQQPMPKQGLSSTFKCGYGFGLWEMAAVAIGISTTVVRPQEWKRVVLAGTAKDKSAAVLFAENRWPELPVFGPRGGMHDGLADAACIAEYGRRVICG